MIRGFAIGFIFFLISVVVIANRGEGDDWWPFISRIPFGDKAGHLGLFGMLSLLCNLAFPRKIPSRLPFFITRATLALLSIISLEELSQAFIPARSLDIADWLADLLGLACGQTLAFFILRRTGKTGTSSPSS
jgi:polysaccharide biosynthesis protein VpsQ